MPRRAMIDFDGTLYTYDGWNNGELNGKLIPGAKKFLQELKNIGYEVVIFTTRASTEVNGEQTYCQLSAVTNRLDKDEVPYDRITSEKISADFYIDDKAIRFDVNDGGWAEAKRQAWKIIDEKI